MNKLKKIISIVAIISLLAAVLGFSGPMAQSAFAAPVKGVMEGANAAQGNGQPADLFGKNSIFVAIVNTLLFIIGAAAVIMLIYGGIRYTISGGDQASVMAAKNTILYAVVGIIVAVMAYAIVNFVLTSINKGTQKPKTSSVSVIV